jgi:hypothetical protein
MMSRLSAALQGQHRTPAGVGLMMLAVNLSLMMAFVILMATILLLSLIGVNIPPGIVIAVFGIGSICLWFYVGMSIPLSFSMGDAARSTLISVSPIALGTAADTRSCSWTRRDASASTSSF